MNSLPEFGETVLTGMRLLDVEKRRAPGAGADTQHGRAATHRRAVEPKGDGGASLHEEGRDTIARQPRFNSLLLSHTDTWYCVKYLFLVFINSYIFLIYLKANGYCNAQYLI